MEDRQIVDLYWKRSERAISESDQKYGRMLYSLSYALLSSREDAEECLNDTWLAAWNAMPTARPAYLGAFLSKITRRISVDAWRREHRKKRGGTDALLTELEECIPARENVEQEYENGRLSDALDRFLAGLGEEKRAVFLRRYFWAQPVSQIAAEVGIGESKVKVLLFRMREKLKKELEEQELL